MLSATFIEAATILLREGLEAILVLSALGAFLLKAGAGNRVNGLYAGAALAVLASIALAWIFEVFNGGNHNDLVEAVVIFAAAAMMLYVSGWLFLKQNPRAWQAYLQTHSDRIAKSGTISAVAILAFFAVFREGAETVLFLHALARTKGGWSVDLASGIVAAAIALVAIYVIISQTSRRLPLRAVFIVTSTFLFLMGLKFLGEGIQELQEQTLVSVHPAPASDALVTLGLNASWEAIGVQLIVLLLAALGIALMRREQPTAA
jgi:high-affinity iron transporter